MTKTKTITVAGRKLTAATKRTSHGGQDYEVRDESGRVLCGGWVNGYVKDAWQSAIEHATETLTKKASAS